MPVGRPKGLPRTGGRKAGTPNKVTADVRALAGKYGPKALETLAKIMGNEKAPPAARVSAAREILDRAYGKAPQPFAVNPANMADALSQVLEQLPG